MDGHEASELVNDETLSPVTAITCADIELKTTIYCEES